MSKSKKAKNQAKINTEVWTETVYEDYLKDLYGFEFIAGFTEGGFPYGIPKETEKISLTYQKKHYNYK